MKLGRVLGVAVLGLSCASSSDGLVTTPAGPGSLVLLREKKISALLTGAKHWEASGVAVVNGTLRVVFDNLFQIANVEIDLSSATLGPGQGDDSQFEAITAGDGEIFVAKEGARGLIEVFDENDVFLREEATDLTFADANKALEGLAYLDETHLLAMGEKDGGKVSVLAKSGNAWRTESTLVVPVTFADFADVGLSKDADGTGYTMAVVSQESRKLWIGHLATAPYRIDGPGRVLAFDAKYCEIEGVAFLDPSTLAMVSDKSDKDGCTEEAESIHVFALP